MCTSLEVPSQKKLQVPLISGLIKPEGFSDKTRRIFLHPCAIPPAPALLFSGFTSQNKLPEYKFLASSFWQESSLRSFTLPGCIFI